MKGEREVGRVERKRKKVVQGGRVGAGVGTDASDIFLGETPTGGHLLVKNLNFPPVL